MIFLFLLGRGTAGLISVPCLVAAVDSLSGWSSRAATAGTTGLTKVTHMLRLPVCCVLKLHGRWW